MFNFNSKEKIILPSGELLEYRIKKTSRRSLGLKITSTGLIVHAPFLTSKKRIAELLEKKIDWITSKLQFINTKLPRFELTNGSYFDLLGINIKLKIQIDDDRKIHLENNVCYFFHKKNDTENIKKEFFLCWLKKFALINFEKQVNIYCVKNNFSINGIALSNAKTRWGTCNSKKNIRLNWRLIQAPFFVIDYVICHELCHLKHMNHSKDFWALVESIFPKYTQAEKFLKENGMTLYRLD